MERLIERACGLDVHRETVVACVRVPGVKGAREQHVRTFGTTTAELLTLRDWLDAHGVTHVAMESTGVYWKPIFYVLEDAFTCLLVNAAHIKQVPGRKTDVLDCTWIAQLLEHGLVRGSFVPPVPIRELRDLTRHRKVLIQERQRAANRLQKLLQDAGIKLASVATDILGVSGRAMLEALAQGTTDPEVLADLARGKLRKKLPAPARGAGRTLPAAPPRRSSTAERSDGGVHRRAPEAYGVEPICAVLPIAPSTYYEHKARERDPDAPAGARAARRGAVRARSGACGRRTRGLRRAQGVEAAEARRASRSPAARWSG